MSANDILSDDGYRADGRKPSELRSIRCKIGNIVEADGSAYLEQGNTKVLATVYGPHAVMIATGDGPQSTKCIVNCSYNISSFSTPGEHRTKIKNDRHTREMCRQLKQTFEATIFTHLNPKSQIDIYIEIIQSDGSNYSASVNAASIALQDAGIPMRDHVCSIVATLVDDTVLIDSNHLEENSSNPEIVLAILPRNDMIAYLQVSSRLHEDQLPRMLKEAIEGCHDIHSTIDPIIKHKLLTRDN